MEKIFLEFRIRGVSMEKDEPNVILEERKGDRRLSVRVGLFEASSIILELEGISSPRPLTHDLLAEVFTEGGFCLDRVELFDASSEGPRARLAYRKGPRCCEKEVRPSDALALALRLGAPILADAELASDVAADKLEMLYYAATRSRIIDFDDWKTGRMRA
jgi:Uncharacterized conserved protein